MFKCSVLNSILISINIPKLYIYLKSKWIYIAFETSGQSTTMLPLFFHFQMNYSHYYLCIIRVARSSWNFFNYSFIPFGRLFFNLGPAWPSDVCAAKTWTNIFKKARQRERRNNSNMSKRLWTKTRQVGA